MPVTVELCMGALDAPARYAAFVDALRQRQGDTGAIVSMVGLVRCAARDGRRLSALMLDHHPRATPASLRRIAEGAALRHGLIAALVCHRAGTMAPGDAIVLVVAAATHRRAAFDAADQMMDQLKSQAVFWKKECYLDGNSAWIEPTAADAADVARWTGSGQTGGDDRS